MIGFVSPEIRPSDSLQVFTFDDDYSFGILQLNIHWEWFIAKCSTLTARFRYTPMSVYETFPWPQDASSEQVNMVAERARNLREVRYKLMEKHDLNLRELYRTKDISGANPLKDAHKKLDNEVRKAYGMKQNESILQFLLDLNSKLAEKEANDAIDEITKPGLPEFIEERNQYISTDCITPQND